jgi:hypothetical protein
MRPTTEAYKKEMRQRERREQFMRIEFGLINPFAITHQNISTNSQKSYSSFQHITEQQVVVDDSYATFENNRTKADGRLLIKPDNPQEYIYQGYISEVLSNANAIFDNQPWINISFLDGGQPIPLNFPGFTLMFDRVMGNYPTRLRFVASRLGNTVYEETLDNNAYMLAKTAPMQNVDNIRITFLSTQEPLQHVYLMNIKYGVGLAWENDDIEAAGGVTKTVDVDPLNRRLPTSTLRLNILDPEHFFNLDDPSGVYEVMENQLPIEAFYGKLIPEARTWGDLYDTSRWSDVFRHTWGDLYSGGMIEWLSVGNFLLDGKPKWHKNIATLNCQDLIGFMTDEYYKGAFQRRSLYDLAIDVINDAGLAPRTDGLEHYALWSGLRDIFTDSPMPILPHNDALRHIAHASNCVLYTDWENIVHIEPIDMTQHDYHIDYEFQTDAMPAAELIASLFAVDSTVTTWHRGSERAILHQTELEIRGTYFDVIKYSPATDIHVEVTGGTMISQNIFSAACELGIQANGMVNIVITGNVLGTTRSIVRVINEGGDENGEVEVLHNTLVTNRNMALAQATHHKNWLRLRTTYKIEYRGDPALECLDLVYSQSPFTEKFTARVLRHEWTFTGALSGNLIVKNTDAVR